LTRAVFWILTFQAQLLCDMRRYKESEAKWRQAATEFKGTQHEPMCLFMANQATEYQGDYERARRSFKAFMDRFRTHLSVGSAARHIVYMLADEGKYAEARAFGEQALKDYPPNRTTPSLRNHLAALATFGKPLPAITATALDGRRVISPAVGKVTLFYEWGPGDKNLHLLGQVLALCREFPPARLTVIGIVRDEARDEALVFQKKHHLPWPNIVGSDVKEKFPMSVLRYATFILDRRGKLRGVGLEDERLFRMVRHLSAQPE